MHTKGVLFAICFAAVTLTATAALADGHRSAGTSRSAATRSSPRFSPATSRPAVTAQRWSGNGTRSTTNLNRSFRNTGFANRSGDWRRHRYHDRFVFVGGFGFPWYYPYSYYDYYPYGYYPYSYSPYAYGGYPAYGDEVYQGDQVYSDEGQDDRGGYNDRRGSDSRGRNKHSVIADVQERLARDGYYKGTVDGVAGDRTYYAIRAYERDHHLRVDGAISNQLLTELGLR
jgi:hypothetical protein